MNWISCNCSLLAGDVFTRSYIVIPLTFSNSIQSNRLYEKHNNDVNIYLEELHGVWWGNEIKAEIERCKTAWSLLAIDQSGSYISFDVKVLSFLFILLIIYCDSHVCFRSNISFSNTLKQMEISVRLDTLFYIFHILWKKSHWSIIYLIVKSKQFVNFHDNRLAEMYVHYRLPKPKVTLF